MANPVSQFQLTDLFNMTNFNSKITDTNTYIETLVEEAKQSGVKIATGSYVGTGTYGADNPCSLTFDFAPTLLWVYAYSTITEQIFTTAFSSVVYEKWTTIVYIPFINDGEFKQYQGLGRNYDNSPLTYSYGKRSADGKTYYWYNDGSASYQLNASGTTYYYIAIG